MSALSLYSGLPQLPGIRCDSGRASWRAAGLASRNHGIASLGVSFSGRALASIIRNSFTFWPDRLPTARWLSRCRLEGGSDLSGPWEGGRAPAE